MFDDFVKVYEEFKQCKVKNPFIETLRLFDIVTKRALSKMKLSVPGQESIDVSRLAQERKKGTPLEYIIGMAPFMDQMLYCSPNTLIPREETELLANVALKFIIKKQETEKELVIIDMGTGCGNIAVSLALNSDNTIILASDLKTETIAVAQKNVEQFDLQERVFLFNGDLFNPLKDLDYENRVDMVVCNPPYIPTASLEKMASEIIDHEPTEAFDAGYFGIDIFRRLINEAPLFLKPQGILVFEIGAGQEKLVTRLLEKKNGYSGIEYFDDGEQVRVISAVHKLVE
jgi:release factor glutamine methyltransferase